MAARMEPAEISVQDLEQIFAQSVNGTIVFIGYDNIHKDNAHFGFESRWGSIGVLRLRVE